MSFTAATVASPHTPQPPSAAGVMPSVPPVGMRMHAMISNLIPHHNSITGLGIRATLDRIGEAVADAADWRISEVPSGTSVLDWTIPQEWILRDASLLDASGKSVATLADHPLTVMGYSQGVEGFFTLEELRPHLHTLPEHRDWIPYRTSYYQPGWGFCLPHRTLEAMERGEFREPFHVRIDADHVDGGLVFGEAVIRGEVADEVLISVHVCHPGMANDNFSAIAVATELAGRVARRKPHLTYRFLFVPGTIGPLAWAATNPDVLPRIRHGLVLANLGDGGNFTYQRSRIGTLDGDRPMDRAVALALRDSGHVHQLRDFVPYGYDERQYGSPGLNLPVGRLTRSSWGEYPEYHTSADNLELVRPEHLAESLEVLESIVNVLEGDALLTSTDGRGEPQLGRRGLYGHLGGAIDATESKMALLWTLNLADGRRTLLDTAERSGISFPVLREAADKLAAAGLLKASRP